MTALTGWDLESTGGNSKKNNFTKFPEGITRIRVLSNAPFMRWSHWMGQFSRKVTCPGFDCPLCKVSKALKASGEQNPKYASTRAFSLNIWNLDKNQAEIMEEGVTMFEVLKDAIADAIEENPGKNLQQFVFRVRKKMGASGKYTWKIDLEEVSDLTEDQSKAVVDMVNLKEYFAPGTVEQLAQLLEVPMGEKDAMIARYSEIMGYTKRDDGESEATETPTFEVVGD